VTGVTEHKLDRGGIIAAVSAFTLWGLVPIYYKGLQEVGAWEVLAHRVIWSVPILLLVLIIRKGKTFWKELQLPLTSIAWLVFSGATVSINWLVFVWAVANDHVLDTSLGYFITPLINVLFGYLFLKERLSRPQIIAVVIAAAGTVYLAWYLGRPPWIALTVGTSFALYGLLRKRLDVKPIPGLLWETGLMFLPALAYLVWLSTQSELQFLYTSVPVDLLLVASGLPTVLPLIWFNMAAQKLPLSILGFFQYIGPSISFMVAVFLFGEVFTNGHAVAFACIWFALLLVSIEPFHRARRRLHG